MEITPEMKQQLNEQKKQCVYCNVLGGKIKGNVVFKDEVVAAILEIHPVVKGHTVFLQKEHLPIMPYLAADVFKHVFGLLPQVVKGIMAGVAAPAVNVFIANGGAAGQKPYPFHFNVHILPRYKGDGFLKFFFRGSKKLGEKEEQMVKHNLPIMMRNHFLRNPAAWHAGSGKSLVGVDEEVVYEDEKAVVCWPKVSVVPGHLVIYAKNFELFEEMSFGDSAHLFYVASFAATALFEGLGMHGTNIILQSGKTDDYEGRLRIHILPRKEKDGLEGFVPSGKEPSYGLDGVASKIKDKLWRVKLPLSGKQKIAEAIKSVQD